MRREPAHLTLLKKSDAKLADRTAALQQAAPPQEPTEPHDNPVSSSKLNDRKTARDRGALSNPSHGDSIAKVRQDLGEAQRSRGLMEARLQSVAEELDRLKLQNSIDVKRISNLAREKSILTTGMKDRDEELRGKAKLLEVRRCASIVIKGSCSLIYP